MDVFEKQSELKFQRIIITLQVDHDSNIQCFSPFHCSNDFLEFLKNELYENERYYFTIRPHPRNPYSLNKSIFLSNQFKNVKISKRRNFEDDLENNDLLITINSTTGYESIVLKKPTITFGQSLYSNYMENYKFKDNKTTNSLFYFDPTKIDKKLTLLEKDIKESSLIMSEKDNHWKRKIMVQINNSSCKVNDFDGNVFLSKRSYIAEYREKPLNKFIFKVSKYLLNL